MEATAKPLPISSRLPKLPPKGQLLLTAVRALPLSVRTALFYELAADPALRPEMEAALIMTEDTRVMRIPFKEALRPMDALRSTANTTVERLAAASYPYLVNASARFVALSGWMANNYVKHGRASSNSRALPFGTQNARRSSR